MRIKGTTFSDPVPDKPELCKDIHDLQTILESSSAVVRWCTNCGAVVVDRDVDGRTMAGAVMKMKFPEMTIRLNNRANWDAYHSRG